MFPRRYRTAMSTGNYIAHGTIPSGWFHTVLNFIGPADGIRAYHDGVEVGRDTNIHGNPKHNGDRRIVIGRYFVKSTTSYSSVQVDELLFFDQMLTDDEITIMSQFSA